MLRFVCCKGDMAGPIHQACMHEAWLWLFCHASNWTPSLGKLFVELSVFPCTDFPQSPLCCSGDMSWSSEDFVAELNDVSKLVNLSQASSTLHDSLVLALQKKLENTSTFMPSDFVRCVEAVENSSLPAEQKQRLSEAVVAKAAAATQEQGNKTVRSPQSLTNLPAYCTKEEMNTLMSGDINLAGVTIVQRLKKVGMTSMKEDTKRAAVALEVQAMIWHGMARPSPDDIYSKAQQLSKMFLADLTSSSVSPVKVYPSLPTGLGEDWVNKVYGTEKPSLLNLPGYASLQNECPVRETHRLLSWNQRKELASSSRRGQASLGGMNLHGCMEKMLGDAMQHMMQNAFGGGQNGLTNLKVFDKKPASAMDQLALARQQLGLPALPDHAPAQPGLPNIHTTAGDTSPAAGAQPSHAIVPAQAAITNTTPAGDPMLAIAPAAPTNTTGAGAQPNVASDPPNAEKPRSLEDFENENMQCWK